MVVSKQKQLCVNVTCAGYLLPFTENTDLLLKTCQSSFSLRRLESLCLGISQDQRVLPEGRWWPNDDNTRLTHQSPTASSPGELLKKLQCYNRCVYAHLGSHGFLCVSRITIALFMQTATGVNVKLMAPQRLFAKRSAIGIIRSHDFSAAKKLHASFVCGSV